MSSCTKEQLLKIANHYEIRVADKKRKDDIKCVILSTLLETCLREGRTCVGLRYLSV